MRNVSRAAAALIFAVTLSAPLSALALASAENPVKSPNHPTSGDLVMEPKTWDGKQITYTGEAITEVQERGDYSWIHVNDDAYYLKNVEEGARLGGYNSGHAIWLTTELAEKIEYFGDYTHEGDVVTVRGTFNAACGQHGGDMDIHATELEVVRPGHEVHEPVHLPKLVFGVVLLALAAVLWSANRRASHMETFGVLGSTRA